MQYTSRQTFKQIFNDLIKHSFREGRGEGMDKNNLKFVILKLKNKFSVKQDKTNIYSKPEYYVIYY